MTAKRTRTRGRGKNKVTETEEVIEIHMWDKLKSLRLLGRHLGMFSAKGPDPIDDLIARLPPEVADQLRQMLRDAVAGKVPEPPE